MERTPLLQDILFRSSLSAVTIRSPVPRGRLQSIECPPLERSYTLITAADIPGKNELADFPVPILASRELSYLGEPVALLVGPDRARLTLYARQCKLIVQEETPVFAAPASAPPPENPESRTAAAPESMPESVPEAETPVAPEPAALKGAGAAPAADTTPTAPSPENPEPPIFTERRLDRGDVEAAFAKAAQTVSGVYLTGIQAHNCGEAVGALAEYVSGVSSSQAKNEEENAQPMFVIHTPTQWPYHVSRSAAKVLGVDNSQIVIQPTNTEITMDSRLWYPSLIACQAALAASLTRRNVRLLLNWEEDFRFSPKRNASAISIQSALGEKGEIRGTRIDLTVDLGGHAAFAQEILDQSCLGVLGIAGSGALSLRARAIRTNIPPQGPYGGMGAAQGIYAMERHQSRLADTLGLDPAEWRKDKYPRKEDLGWIVPPLDPPPATQLLDTVAAMGDYYRKWASYELLRRRRRQEQPPERPEALRGIGIALGWQGNGLLYAGTDQGDYGLEVTLSMDGSLEIRTSAGAGFDLIRIWSAIARETLGVEEDKIRVVSKNTAISPDSGPACLSRNVTCLSSLVDQCCQAIRNQRFRDPLPITVRKNYCPESPKAGELKSFRPAEGYLFDAGSLRRPGWGAAVVEIELEPHSYTPAVRGLWLAIDGGKILSDTRARRVLKLASIQALGWASREYLDYQAGRIDSAQISAYGILDPREVPPIHIDFLWNDAAPKGIEELPFCCVPAAYIQAVSQAVDHPFETIPQKPDNIWDILKTRLPGESAGAAGETGQ